MRIAFITSGAAGMYCGSCMKDNTLASALIAQGHEALLIPTYTPIRTDEDDVSTRHIFFGGINVYLEQKSWLFRHTPWFVDKLLNFPRLLRWVSGIAVKTQAKKLGGLTVSMLQGTHGKQRKEIAKLLQFLKNEARPDVIILSNLLISGLVPEAKAALGVPILGTMQGDDIYLEALPAEHRRQCIDLVRENSRNIDGHFATSAYYADFMAGYLGLSRERIHVVHPGIKLKEYGEPREHREQPPYTIGYFARICPEKGLHHLVEAFRLMRRLPNAPACKLRISGWLGSNNRNYFDEQMAKLRADGLGNDVEHVPSPNHAGKIAFLRSLDVLSVPTVYREPKGIYILEALANGTPVVQPGHGSFPELLAATGGGLLVEPDNPQALAEGLCKLLTDRALRRECGQKGQAAVRERFTADRMGSATVEVLKQYVQ
jgi:glycosyltransferase involved in cell wall biosynthesis